MPSVKLLSYIFPGNASCSTNVTCTKRRHRLAVSSDVTVERRQQVLDWFTDVWQHNGAFIWTRSTASPNWKRKAKIEPHLYRHTTRAKNVNPQIRTFSGTDMIALTGLTWLHWAVASEKLTDAKMFINFAACYETRTFITVFTRTLR
jgi:hypothetical protein